MYVVAESFADRGAYAARHAAKVELRMRRAAVSLTLRIYNQDISPARFSLPFSSLLNPFCQCSQVV